MAEIKIRELSIGDWVECLDEPMQVYWIEGDSVGMGVADVLYYSCNVAEVKPIPLTPEILESNGFVKSSECCWSNPSIECACLRYGTRYWNMRIQGRNRAYRPTRINIDNILHTHQLQHALRLAGVEKEIVL